MAGTLNGSVAKKILVLEKATGSNFQNLSSEHNHTGKKTDAPASHILLTALVYSGLYFNVKYIKAALKDLQSVVL